MGIVLALLPRREFPLWEQANMEWKMKWVQQQMSSAGFGFSKMC